MQSEPSLEDMSIGSLSKVFQSSSSHLRVAPFQTAGEVPRVQPDAPLDVTDVAADSEILTWVLLFLSCIILAWTLYRTSALLDTYRTINKRGNEFKNKSLDPRQRALKPLAISIYELFVWFLTQDANFVFQYFVYTPICIFCLRYVTPWLAKSVKDKTIVDLCLNTSFVLHLKHVSGSIFCYEQQDIGWHSMPAAGFSNTLCFSMDIDTSTVLSFTFNGEDIENRQQMLSMLMMHMSDCLHPQVHSFQNALHDSLKKAPSKYWRMTVHGQFLNENAHSHAAGPWLGFNGDTAWLEKVLETHAVRPIPFHGNFDKSLAKASSYVQFASKARSIVFQELSRSGDLRTMVDAEAYFLCSIIHSMDHWQTGTYGEWVDFSDDLKYTPRFNYFYRNFIPHCQYWFLPNNYFRSHCHETELYRRIYTRMRAVDPYWADVISISLTY